MVLKHFPLWIFSLLQCRCTAYRNSHIEIAHFTTQDCAVGYKSQYGTVLQNIRSTGLLRCSGYCLLDRSCKLFNWFQTRYLCELRNYDGYIFERQLCNLSLSVEPGAVVFFNVRFSITIDMLRFHQY